MNEGGAPVNDPATILRQGLVQYPQPCHEIGVSAQPVEQVSYRSERLARRLLGVFGAGHDPGHPFGEVRWWLTAVASNEPFSNRCGSQHRRLQENQNCSIAGI